MTARDLITRAFRLIRVLPSGETLGAAEASDALAVLGDLVDAWRNENLTLFSQARTVISVVNGQQTYTIGSGGDFNIERPIWIDGLAFQSASGYEQRIAGPISRDDWQRISQKDQTGTLPELGFYNPEYPLGKLEIWPIPTDTTVSLVLYTPAGALASVASLDTAISVPPGWSKALRYNLALDLAPEFNQTPDPSVVAQAIELKAAIKRANFQINESKVDPALRYGNASAWDYRTGDFR
jgi:hypothetical protein